MRNHALKFFRRKQLKQAGVQHDEWLPPRDRQRVRIGKSILYTKATLSCGSGPVFRVNGYKGHATGTRYISGAET